MKNPDIIRRISGWQGHTFPDSTLLGLSNHLVKEAEEVRKEVRTYVAVDSDPNSQFSRYTRDCLKHEICDNMFFHIAICEKMGISFAEFVEAMEETLARNQLRKWGKPDSDGVIEHVG